MQTKCIFDFLQEPKENDNLFEFLVGQTHWFRFISHEVITVSFIFSFRSTQVRDQEFAAVNTITVLPQRTNLDGKSISNINNNI